MLMSSTMANTIASNAMAAAMNESFWFMTNRAFCRLLRPSSAAKVYSPSTTAIDTKQAERIAVRKLGMITLTIVPNHELPNVWDASKRVRTSSWRNPASRAR